jgi:glutamate N-acetyltransferase / amino-acid N-acetyltransferase
MNVRLEPAVVDGFRCAGVTAGLRAERGRPDLGIIVADSPVAAAAVFTTNLVKAAPVQVAREHLGGGRLQAVAVNSGSANCFTGKAGLKLARDSATCLARAIGCDPKLVAPCSTGVIGHLYDLGKYREGITAAVAALDAASLGDFANAILTTDTRAKIASLQTTIDGTPVTVAGCAKGAGMIQPKMATMLAFILTDAAAPSTQLRALLKRILPVSFNAVTVDGDMSTNDTLILLASGAAGNRRLSGRGLAKFEQAVGAVAETLARELVRDGEGATKLVRIDVRGARTAAAADRVAREIANSPLVKTAFFGCDPNFGRIAMAAGKAGVAIDTERLEVSVGGIRIASGGALNVAALPAAGEKMKQPEFDLVLNLKQGKASARVMTCDLSFDYVKINAEYTT